MSDLDALAESARNRGLKLVRSRVRTPGKRRFGKVGLSDGQGKAVFGLDDKGPTATPDEVEEHLRSLGAKDWTASLGPAGATRARKKARARPKPPPSPPTPKLRDARPGDAEALARLLAGLGFSFSTSQVKANLRRLKQDGLPQLVAELDGRVVGLAGLDRMEPLHRPRPVARITILVVEESLRGHGIGRALVERAVETARGWGCGMIELTSHNRLIEAHRFYQHLGFDQTSRRFCKSL